MLCQTRNFYYGTPTSVIPTAPPEPEGLTGRLVVFFFFSQVAFALAEMTW